MTSEQQSLSEVKDDSDTSASQGYEEVALSEVVDPVLGKTPKRKNDDYWQGDIKWASAKDISQNSTRRIYDTAEYMTAEGKDASNAKKMPEGTLVVIARGATMGRSAQLGEPMTFNQTCYGLDADNDKLLDDFLYYVWQYRFNQIQSVSHGTVFDTITMDSFKDIDIPLPSLETQKRICNVLTSIDNKIETNNRVNDILEEISRSVFNYLFVDFEPYDQFKNSEIGNVPSSFDINTLEEVLSFQRGHSYSGDEMIDEDSNKDIKQGYPMINLGNIEPGGGYRTENIKYCENIPNDRYLVEPGDLVISHTDMTQDQDILGSPVMVPDLDNRPILFSHHLYSIKDCDLPEEFLYYYFLSPYFKPKAESFASGTTVLSFSSKIASDVKIPIPPEEDVNDYLNVVRPIFERIETIRKENKSLTELRDALLPKLMSGEIGVNNINPEDLEASSEV